MLVAERLGIGYSKAEHRRRVGPLLAGRSEKSIEFKWCNVSAVLYEAGIVWLSGYKPLPHYQERLGELAALWLMEHRYLGAMLNEDGKD